MVLNWTGRPALLVAWSGAPVPTLAPVTGVNEMLWSALPTSRLWVTGSAAW